MTDFRSEPPAATLPTPSFAWDNMFLTPEDDPRSDGNFDDEREMLVNYLRDQRLTLELKCAGLDAEQLARPAVPPSPLSLLGLVRHMSEVESAWFRSIMAGEDAPRLYRTDSDQDADFTGAVADPAVVAEAWDTWRAQVAYAGRFVAENDLGVKGKRGNEEITLRELLVHMIEEYARHNGHADFLRERIDGRVGQ
ncbi:DinB family protein [Micromonospora sp. CPCC 205711]|uniref:DinB family protein n=1 Tax=Micromonospora sp. CPCC 205547 TaxID=3122400 RepID=UPI002FEF464E